MTDVRVIFDEDQLRQMALEAVKPYVAEVLRDQLDGIVNGEFAKMRLLQPGSKTISQIVEEKMRRSFAAAMGVEDMREYIRTAIGQKVGNAVNLEAKLISKTVRERLKHRVTRQMKEDGLWAEGTE